MYFVFLLYIPQALAFSLHSTMFLLNPALYNYIFDKYKLYIPRCFY